MSYVELADIRNWVGIQDSGDDPELDAALLSVDAVIDDYCGQRFAQDSGVVSARLFVADTTSMLRLFPSVVGDTTGMIVKVDIDGDGTFETTLSSSDYVTLPLSGVGPDGRTGWPVTGLRADGLLARYWPIHRDRPGVQVTALWGWATTPAPVKLAARMLVVAWHQRRATVAGQGGFTGFFESAVRDDPTVRDLLAPYRRRAKAQIG